MLKTKSKIINLLINMLFLLPFINFPSYILYGTPRVLFKLLTDIVYVLIIVIYFRKNKFKIPLITILVIIMQMIPVISTYYGDRGQLNLSLKMLIGYTCISFLIDYNIKNNKKDFLKSICILFGILVTINITTFFLYYPSMDPTQDYFYFLGNDNGSIYETLLFIYITIVYYLTYNKKIPKFFYLIIIYILFGYLYVKSGNGLLCMTLTILFITFNNIKILKKVIMSKIFWPIYIFFFMNIVLFRKNNFLLNCVLNILEKSNDFSGRTYIWDKCIYYIKKHPFIGNGYESMFYSINKIGKNKAHNLILQYLYNGGLFMLIIFALLIHKVMKQIKKSSLELSIKVYMFFCIYLFFIISIMDFYFDKFSFIIIILTYYFIALHNKESKYERNN